MIIVLVAIGIAIIGAVLWNRRTAATAMEGVTFSVNAPICQTSAAIHSAINVGARAKASGVISGVKLQAAGDDRFQYTSRLGDVGEIELTSTDDGTAVTAHTEQLHRGRRVPPSSASSWWGLCTRLDDSIQRFLGVTPGAARMKRFQHGLEKKLTKELNRGVDA